MRWRWGSWNRNSKNHHTTTPTPRTLTPRVTTTTRRPRPRCPWRCFCTKRKDWTKLWWGIIWRNLRTAILSTPASATSTSRCLISKVSEAYTRYFPQVYSCPIGVLSLDVLSLDVLFNFSRLVGPSGGGKTQIFGVLRDALSAQRDVQYREQRINPKAIRAAEMYGVCDFC